MTRGWLMEELEKRSPCPAASTTRNARLRIHPERGTEMNTHSQTPTVGYFVMAVLSTEATPDLLPYRVTRVNLNTGRGTVRHVATDKALQIVRGRFGWLLADGTRRPVRFAVATELVHADTAGVAHSTNPRVGDLLDAMVPGDKVSENRSHVWQVTEVAPNRSWALARRTHDRSMCLMVVLDSAGCYRTSDGTRVWFVTPAERQPDNADGWITYTSMAVHKSKGGVLTTWSLRENGRLVGTMFCHNGESWESAYSEDLKWATRRDLAESMLSQQGRQARRTWRTQAASA